MKVEEREKIIQELYAEYPFADESSFNEFDIYDKLQQKEQLFIKYKEQYFAEKAALDYLLDLKDQLAGKIYNLLRFEDDRQLIKSEIEKYYIPNDKRMIKLNDLIAKQSVRVEFFDLAANSINNMGWNIKNWLDAQKNL
jgi:hypothetical protein